MPCATIATRLAGRLALQRNKIGSRVVLLGRRCLQRPLALTDDQLTAILHGAQPLRPHDRDDYLRAVADALANGGGLVGDGDVNRAIRAAQKKFFDPPILSYDNSKYR